MSPLNPDKERERYFSHVQKREKKLRELQEKWEEVLPHIADPVVPPAGVPEIKESIENGGHDAPLDEPGLLRRNRLAVIALALATISLSLIRISWHVTAMGEALPADRSTVRAPFDGMLRSVHFREGELVKQGDLIGELRSDDLAGDLTRRREELGILKGQLGLMKGQLNRLKDSLDRKERFFQGGIIPVGELEKARSDYDESMVKRETLNRERARLVTQIAMLEDRISQSHLKAPISGVIVTHNLNENRLSFFEKGEKICEIADLSNWVVDASIPEDKVKEISVGQDSSVKFDLYRKAYNGRVRKIGEFSGRPVQKSLEDILRASGGETKKGVIVTIELLQRPPLLKYGMNAKVKITTGRMNVYKRLFQF